MRRPSYPIDRLDYELPAELIAQQPASERAQSRLMYVNVKQGSISDHSFSELPGLLPAACTILLNESRVIPARLYGRRGQLPKQQGGGRVEVVFHRVLADGEAEALVGSSARLLAGEVVELPAGWRLRLLENKRLDGMRVSYLTPEGERASAAELYAYLNEHGVMPTPPYIKRDAETVADASSEVSQHDRKRYQTSYARVDGSVAAPTAGLHFDGSMLAGLSTAGHSLEKLALHVGLGTFAPVRVADLAEHAMHEEQFSLSLATLERLRATVAAPSPLLCVGTTSLRAAASLLDEAHPEREQHTDFATDPPQVYGSTSVFFYPGHGTGVGELLLTNFHLPRSTLLALVYSFGGEQLLRQAYEHAIEQRYRFFSYGDCLLIDRSDT